MNFNIKIIPILSQHHLIQLDIHQHWVLQPLEQVLYVGTSSLQLPHT